MKQRWLALSCCIIIAATLAGAQKMDEGYQMGKVVAFERVSADAHHMEDSGRYNISMRLEDMVYRCRSSSGTPAAVFIVWTVGKEFPTKVNGKILQVKNPDGQMVELSILGQKKAK